ncbi:MAG: GNAT family N-acetyltransferase [Verrucomicrobiota bacterium]
MQLREIKAEDMQTIFDIRVATWHNERGREELTQLGITHDSVREQIKETHKGWLCEVDRQAVGFAMGDRTTGEMWVIAVLKAFEGRGIGGQLLQRVEAWLGSEGWNEIWLTTDQDETLRAVGFYRHLGWIDWKFEHGDRYMKKTFEAEA